VVTVTKELVAQDLLTVLHSLPIEAIGMYLSSPDFHG